MWREGGREARRGVGAGAAAAGRKGRFTGLVWDRVPNLLKGLRPTTGLWKGYRRPPSQGYPMNMFKVIKTGVAMLVTFGLSLVALNIVGIGMFWSLGGCMLASLPALVLGGIVWKGCAEAERLKREKAEEKPGGLLD